MNQVDRGLQVAPQERKEMGGSPYLASGEHGVVRRRHVAKEAGPVSSRSGERARAGGRRSGIGSWRGAVAAALPT